MSDITFGDIEPDDSYVAGNVADPEHVAMRLHELRIEIDNLVGRDPARWDALTGPERVLAASIGRVIVEWITTHEPDQPEQLAADLHGVRRFWTGDVLARWEDLSDDERAIGVEMMRLIIGWLEREGSL